MKTVYNTKQRKKDLLKALELTLGVVTPACKETGISRGAYYLWMQKDEKFRKSVEDISEIALDFAENQLHKNMKAGDTTSTIFYLKTKGKKRGYIEKQEIEHSGTTTVNNKLDLSSIAEEARIALQEKLERKALEGE